MNIKQLAITFVSGLMLGGVFLVSGASVSASQMESVQISEVKENITLDANDDLPEPELAGLKKSAVVWALKKSSGLPKMFSPLLSKKNMEFLSDNAWAIGNKLDKLDKYGQGQLASFLIGIGIPSGSARTIAYIVFFVAF